MPNATAETLVAYYKATLIAQYRDKTKAQATIGALMGGSDGSYGLIADAIVNQVRDGFDLETAVGVQLDMLGKLRGVTRFLATLSLGRIFLPLVPYDDPDVGILPGIATYEDAVLPPTTYTMTYDDFTPTRLADADFRRVIQFLAALSSAEYTYAKLDLICYSFFEGNVNLKITGNMAITYQHLTSDTDDLFAIINQLGLLPAPAGVSVATAEVAAFT